MDIEKGQLSRRKEKAFFICVSGLKGQMFTSEVKEFDGNRDENFGDVMKEVCRCRGITTQRCFVQLNASAYVLVRWGDGKGCPYR